MNKEFIPYEQALELKELGFDELCLFYYGDNESLRIYHQSEISEDLMGAPLYQQAFRWFREKYSLVHCIGTPDLYPIKGERFSIGIGVNHIAYEEIEFACLKKLIKTVKGVNEDKIGEYFANNADIKIEIVKNK